VPDITTHYLMGEKTLASLEKRNINLFKFDDKVRRAYNWGCVGPDTMFFALPFGKGGLLPSCGRLTHRTDGASVLTAMAEYLEELRLEDSPDYELVRAYTAGFVTHYVLDKNAHPYIYFLQEKYRRRLGSGCGSFLHSVIERNIDTLLYQAEYDMPVDNFDMYEAFGVDEKVFYAVGRMYVFLCETVLNVDIKSHYIRRSWKLMQASGRVLYDSRGRIGRLFAGMMPLLVKTSGLWNCRESGFDDFTAVINPHKEPWYNLWYPEQERHESFGEILMNSCDEAANLLAANLAVDSFTGCHQPFLNGKPALAPQFSVEPSYAQI